MTPFDFVNFLFYFQALKIVKLKQVHAIDINNSGPWVFYGALTDDRKLPQAHDSETLFYNGTQDVY